MRVVILTQYYPPETGAPQNRLSALAHSLTLAGHEVTVLTAMPHYPAMKIHEDYRGKWVVEEEVEGVDLLRTWIYARRNKGLITRLLNYFSFVFTSMLWGTFKLSKHDVLILESPPLFLAISARWLCLVKRMKLVTNVSDLWPESAVSLGLISNKMMIKAATFLENGMYRSSQLISGQTKGIVEHISGRFPNKPYVWFPNGADLKMFKPQPRDDHWREQFGLRESDILCCYAGILGHAQGLETIVLAAVQFRQHIHVQFVLVGDGPMKEELKQLVNKLGLTNVHFQSSIPRKELIKLLSAVDISIVPLKNSPLFLGAIPSKIFENLAMEIPVVMGVKGEAYRLFVEEGD
ncbi:MAG: glycosyltransferase family 4 protein, partial [Flavobacteriales bacterium]|nr:glycosyltransferase family 4 protein [Flavobacteriales bacterium]